MYTGLVLLLALISRIQSLLILLAILGTIWAIICLCYFLTKNFNHDGSPPNFMNEHDGEAKKKRWRFRAVLYPLLAVFFIVLTIFMPNKVEVVSYIVAGQVDSYNKATKSSSFYPQNFISGADNTIKSIDSIVEKVGKLLEGKIDKAIDKASVTTPEKK